MALQDLTVLLPSRLGCPLSLKTPNMGNVGYDLFYVWSGVGVPEVAGSLATLQPSAYIDDALSVIERDFSRHDGLGPLGTAQFITQGPDDNVQADVVGYAQEILRFMGTQFSGRR